MLYIIFTNYQFSGKLLVSWKKINLSLHIYELNLNKKIQEISGNSGFILKSVFSVKFVKFSKLFQEIKTSGNPVIEISILIN